MFEKVAQKKLSSILNSLSTSQKDQLTNILKDEESLKKAISSLNPEKLQKTAQDLNLNESDAIDLNKMIKEAKENPDLLNNIKKNFK